MLNIKIEVVFLKVLEHWTTLYRSVRRKLGKPKRLVVYLKLKMFLDYSS